MRKLACSLIAAFTLATSAALAGTVTVDVNSQTGPWLTTPTLNPTFSYGVGDNLAPVAIGGFTPGETVTISATGLTSEFAFVAPDTDANGFVSVFSSDQPGSSGTRFPGFYTVDPANVYLGALIGTFADSTGAILGTPFFIGVGPTSVTAVGEFLLLGITDDIYADNSGSLSVSVTAPSIGAVPEPATWAMMLLGFAGMGFMAYRRRERIATVAT